MIYALKLEDNKYYIGYSKNNHTCDIRLMNHFNENGSKWTKKYKPISVIEKINGDMFDEEKYTLLYMDKYGIDNVRGGSYSQIILSQNDKDKALQTIRSILNRCYLCDSTEHYSNCCPKKSNKTKQHFSHDKSKLHNLGKAYNLLETGIFCSKEKYHEFADKCVGDCQQCDNSRIEYKYWDGEDEIYCSCIFCYAGDDWQNDMFVGCISTNHN
jgi:hypothetical protein